MKMYFGTLALGLIIALPALGAGETRLADGRAPQVVVDDRGLAHVVYAHDGAIVTTTIPPASTGSGGVEKRAEVTTVANPSKLMAGMRRGPRVVALPGSTLVVTAIDAGMKDGSLLAWRSTDGGTVWTAGDKPINTVDGSAREGLHGMAASRDGKQVFVVWLDLRESKPKGPSATQVRIARSTDDGRTWEPDRLVYRNPQSGTVCECCHPSVAVSADGTVYVMFRNFLAGSRDLYLSTSRDGGQTFDPDATKLGEGTWPLNACPMDGGSLAVDDAGRPVTAWMRAGEAFVARPGEREAKLGVGGQPLVVPMGDRTWAAYTGNGAFHGSWLGVSSVDDDVIATAVTMPAAAREGDKIRVVWERQGGIFSAIIPRRW